MKEAHENIALINKITVDIDKNKFEKLGDMIIKPRAVICKKVLNLPNISTLTSSRFLDLETK